MFGSGDTVSARESGGSRIRRSFERGGDPVLVMENGERCCPSLQGGGALSLGGSDTSGSGRRFLNTDF